MSSFGLAHDDCSDVYRSIAHACLEILYFIFLKHLISLTTSNVIPTVVLKMVQMRIRDIGNK